MSSGTYGQIPEKASDAQLEELLDGAPIPTGQADFSATATQVARTIIPFFRWRDLGKIVPLMVARWLPRCPKCDSISPAKIIKDAINDARKEFEAEQHERAYVTEKESEHRPTQIRRERKATPVKANPPTMAEVAGRMGVSERYAFTVKKRGFTSNRKHAVVMSTAFGGSVGDWYVPEGQRGRKRDWASFLMREGAQEFPFWNFVAARADGDDWRLFELAALRERTNTPRDFSTLTALVNFAADNGVDLGSAEEATQLWFDFADWRLDEINRAAKHGKGTL